LQFPPCGRRYPASGRNQRQDTSRALVLRVAPQDPLQELPGARGIAAVERDVREVHVGTEQPRLDLTRFGEALNGLLVGAVCFRSRGLGVQHPSIARRRAFGLIGVRDRPVRGSGNGFSKRHRAERGNVVLVLRECLPRRRGALLQQPRRRAALLVPLGRGNALVEILVRRGPQQQRECPLRLRQGATRRAARCFGEQPGGVLAAPGIVEEHLLSTLPHRHREDGVATAALDAERSFGSRNRPLLEGKDGVAAAALDDHGQLLAVSLLSSPNAVCSARTASSAYFSSIRHEILISEVLITRMFTPSSASTWNILAATPAWLRIPTPTMLTFAMPSSCSTFPAPICLPILRTSSLVFSASRRPTVNAMSVRPSSLAGV